MDFYFGDASFTSGRLSIEITDGRVRMGTLRFDFVRSFLFVKESDFWPEFEKNETQRLLGDGGLAPHVFRVLRGGLLQSTLAGRMDEEEPSFFLLWTPDECFEVVAFAAPVWIPISSERAGAEASV